MIKAKIVKNGRTIVLLGLSHANLDRLREQGLHGHIEIKGEDLEIGPVDILITAAETEQVMLETFIDGVREGTKLRIDPRLKS